MYRCLDKARLREGFEKDSAEAGFLKKHELVESVRVLERLAPFLIFVPVITTGQNMSPCGYSPGYSRRNPSCRYVRVRYERVHTAVSLGLERPSNPQDTPQKLHVECRNFPGEQKKRLGSLWRRRAGLRASSVTALAGAVGGQA